MRTAQCATIFIPVEGGSAGASTISVTFTLLPAWAGGKLTAVFNPNIMGQQLNKIIKRRRRKAYLERKKTLAKSGVVRKSSRVKAEAGSEEKKAVKKPSAKKSTKVPAVKKVEAKAPEAEAQA
jgi:hypothetical protein